MPEEPLAGYEHHLRRLLDAVRAPGRTVVMLGIPLPPFASEYGRIQRALAEDAGVALIPKRHFARILAGPDATIDGLHFTDSGHQEMARTVAQLIDLPWKK